MAKKAKDMDSLLRLNRWTVDERRRELGVLQAREEELLTLGDVLERQMEAEQKVAADDPTSAGFVFGAFAANHRRRREQLAQTLFELRAEIEAARDRLAAAFRQLKVYEEVQDKRALQERQEEARKEQIVLDEIGQIQHRRRQEQGG